MQLKYKHKQPYLLSFCLLSCLISCGSHISCEQSSQARGGKANLGESCFLIQIQSGSFHIDIKFEKKSNGDTEGEAPYLKHYSLSMEVTFILIMMKSGH